MAVALKEDTFASYPDFGGFLFTLTKYTDTLKIHFSEILVRCPH